MIETVLNLKFLDADKNVYTLALSDTKEGLTSAEIKLAMDELIASDVLLGKGGEIVSRSSANLVTRDTDKFEV